MKNRIVQLRKGRGWTQDEFAEKMGISKNYVSLIENGKKIPSNRLVSDICREFNASKDWLLTGDGEPTIKRTRNQEIASFMNDIMELPDEDFKKRLIEALSKLKENQWEVLAEIAESMRGDG